ncbi:16641_t:CDS:2, partial [Racocetra persica]
DQEAKEMVIKGVRPSPFSENTPEQYEEIKHKFNDLGNVPSSPSSQLLPVERIITELHNKGKYDEAFVQFEQLAQNDDPLALYYTGLYLYEGTYGSIKRDVIRALQFFLRSAKHGKSQSKYKYAYACLTGPYYSFEEGINYLKMAMKDNDPDALYMASQIYLNGEHGYSIDNAKYQKYLKDAAKNGSTIAQKDLAILC